MKKCLFVTLAAVAVVLAGCVVTSVCPFYTQKELGFEPALLGNWINEKNTDEVWRFQKSSAQAYRFTLLEEHKATVMEAHAFKLQGQLFLDVVSIEQDIHVIPAHYLLKISQLRPLLRMSELDDEWLIGLLRKDPTLLRHHIVKTGDKPEDRRIVLTANTPELQKFVITHLNTKEAWSDSIELRPELPGNSLAPDALGGILTEN